MNRPLRILIIDNTREPRSFGSKNLVHWVLKMAPQGSEVLVRRAPDQDLPRNLKFDALVISGSMTSCLETKEAWVAPLDVFVTEQITNKRPVLGVCYGHQVIARCLFKMNGMEPRLGKSKDAELGWQTIRVTKENPLFQGLPSTFVTYESHYEEVSEIPPGTTVFADSSRCEIQAFALENAPIFGIQFHPEHTIEEAETSMKNKLAKGERKDWILNPGLGPKLYNDKVGESIFGNFFKIAGEYRRE